MPNLGSGILTGLFGPFKPMSAMYLATYNASSLAAAPTAALGASGEPPSGTWTKLGLLEDDMLTIATVAATFVEDRRGAKKVLYAKALTQAGSATLTANIVETNPDEIGKVNPNAATTIGAGKKIQITYDQIVYKTVLAWQLNHFDQASERYIYVPKAQLEFSIEKGANDVAVIKVTVNALQYTFGATNYLYEEGQF